MYSYLQTVLGKSVPVFDRVDILNRIPVKCYLSNLKLYMFYVW